MTRNPTAPRAAAPREATRDDLPAIRELLARRDAREWTLEQTAWFVLDLDPERCLAWIAFAGERPIALSTLYLRPLRGPGVERLGGYWANLYVDPEHRDQMLYPRLPLAMFAAARARGVEVVYGSTRQRDVAFAHTRIGFTTTGTMPVLAKPLRPFRLLGKYRRQPLVRAVAPPLDALWAAGLASRRPRPPAGVTIGETTVAGAFAAELAATLAENARDLVAQAWTPGSLAFRYAQTREGGRYHAWAARRGADLVAAVVARVAEREPAIRAGVFMELVAAPGEDAALAATLATAERFLDAQGCELAMHLDGLGSAIGDAFRAAGYRPLRECYDLQVWPKAQIEAAPILGDAARWRVGFGDHDAF